MATHKHLKPQQRHFYITALPGSLAQMVLVCVLWLALNGSVAATEFAMLEAHDRDNRLQVNEVLVRKQERRLYLIAGDRVVKSYQIGLGDNPVGHKLHEGDERTPEGHYTLDWRNPESSFYKSIHISYPNAEDRELASSWGLNPGGNIMIHGLPNHAKGLQSAYLGLDWTNGCIAVSNEEMDEIWELVDDGTPIRILP